MRFRVQNIRKGYCEVWANERDGQRYRWIAYVKRLNDGWQWLRVGRCVYRDGLLPDENHTIQRTRRDCVNDCMKMALKRLVNRAIEQQPKESPHWHSPRRDAWCDVSRHDYLFAHDELEEIDKRLKTFEEES